MLPKLLNGNKQEVFLCVCNAITPSVRTDLKNTFCLKEIRSSGSHVHFIGIGLGFGDTPRN